ncbi:alpha/beta hydrolase [Actinoplanes sp. M2I2]|uniref:alpha/beta hydrolase n=1 Tax=Actinoplanes sp. M2I2 TaxID=1734444 RepID=UPI002021DEEE|nr:alpha/beta hydrolase [Actinoplanes sp. M2I2]
MEGGSTAALLDRVDAVKASRAYDFPYDNGLDAGSTVICTDGKHPARAESWPAAVDRRDREAPYFGRSWGWIDSQCANQTWTVRDKNAYTGPFTKRTADPFLIVGNYWDPATSYQGAVSSDRLAPNARLLSSNNWGHTAYGSGVCATTAIDTYLLTGRAPKDGTTCTDAAQPFTEPLPSSPAAATKAATGKQRPPVVSPRPISILG